MSGYLLDTNAVSMFFKPDVDPEFARWVDKQQKAHSIRLSAVTIHELEKGAGLLDQKGATRKAAAVRLWLTGLIAVFDDRVLPVDAEIAKISGNLEAKAIASGYQVGVADAMIAGTAKYHQLIVITHNVKHFSRLDVDILSPDQIAG